jgi:hypothetical protein
MNLKKNVPNSNKNKSVIKKKAFALMSRKNAHKLKSFVKNLKISALNGKQLIFLKTMKSLNAKDMKPNANSLLKFV